ALPAPNATQVGTALRTLNLSTGGFDQVTTADVADIEADRRTIRNVFELGYKGVIEGRILVGVDAYLTRVSDEFGELLAATPNVFLDQATLELYLGNFLPAAQAAQLADEITRIPLGTVSPEEAGDADVVLVQRQGSAYTLWGADFSITAEVTPQFSVRCAYSWTSRNSITNLSTSGNVILSVPKHKASVALGYRNDNVGFSTKVGARAVSTFPVASGVLRGQVTSYALLDASVRYRLPWAPNVRVSINAQNIFDNRHQEFAGAPELGRLLTTRLHVTF
ncbi:MAG: TonB-dependent receptor, partial [Gemmatimonadetes bacterium]|nr:TonB-dependent receptor [Gemmatimonadota bacterium]